MSTQPLRSSDTPADEPLAASMAPVAGLRARRVDVVAICSALVAGGLVWSQLCSAALDIELTTAPLRSGVVLLLVMPLVVLVATLLLQRPLAGMVLFPLSLLPCSVVISPLDVRPLNTVAGGLWLGASLTVYLAATARVHGHTPRRVMVRGDALKVGTFPRFWWMLMWAMVPRVVLLVALVVVPLGALYGEEGAQLLREHFPKRAVEARFLIHVLHLFVSLIAAYVALISPLLHRKLERYEMRERLRYERSRARARRRWLTVAVSVALTVIAMVIWLAR